MCIYFDVFLHIRFHYSSWFLLFVLQTHKSRNNYKSRRSPTRAKGKEWSSNWSGPGKSERSVWAVRASKVKYTACSKFLTCCSGQRDLWGVTSSGRCVVLCSWSLQALVQPSRGVRGDAPTLCPPALCSDPAPRGLWKAKAYRNKSVHSSSLTVLQTGSQDCIEGYNSWQKASKQKSVILNKRLACSLLFQKRYFASSEAAAGGFSAGWGFPKFCERRAASPALTFHLLTKCQSPGLPPLYMLSFSSAGWVPFTVAECTPLLFHLL